MSTSNTKQLTKRTQTILKELGYDVSLGHAYELLSKIAGHKTWAVESRDENLVTKVQAKIESELESVGSPKINDSRYFKVFLKKAVEAEKAYYIQAKDEAEAKMIMNQYIDYQNGELSEFDSKGNQTGLKKGVVLHPEVEKLASLEDYSAFVYGNWAIEEHAVFGESAEIAQIYNA